MRKLNARTIKPVIDYTRQHPGWILALLLCLLILPWIGLTPFNTKGEPREAIVAVAMLQSGDWVLPLSFGAEMPYKPPFLAWCIAAVSYLTGGVTPFTSRLPSALAAIGLALITYRMVKRSGGPAVAFTTALVLATSMEVWRAASACRVDMVLTFFIVAALYTLYIYINRGMRGLPWIAIAAMSCGVLTKGPVGMLLPCLAAGVYALIRGERFVAVLWRLAAAGVMSLLLPAVWYVAAAQTGGSEFIDLAMEENFGRFTGRMSYSSHEKPVWYNFVMIASGLLPYTLFALFCLFSLRRPAAKFNLRRMWTGIKELEPWRLFALVSAVVIFAFYCIPKSKRGVYLLPVYPMAAYFITLLLLRARSVGPLRVFATVLAAIAIILPIGLWSAAAVWGPGVEQLLGGNAAMVHAFCEASTTPSGLITLALTLCAGGYALQAAGLRQQRVRGAAMATVYALLLPLSASLLPHGLALKSDRPTAEQIAATVTASEPLFEYLPDGGIRFYTINFYLADRLRSFSPEGPASGYVLMNQPDLDKWESLYADRFGHAVLHTFDHRSCDTRQPLLLLRFWRR